MDDWYIIVGIKCKCLWATIIKNLINNRDLAGFNRKYLRVFVQMFSVLIGNFERKFK